MKHLSLRKIISSCLGGAIIASPFIACQQPTTTQISSVVQNSTLKTDKNQINDDGITLSSYEVEGWTNSSHTIQVFNKNIAITNDITWTSADSTKVYVEKTSEESDTFTIHFTNNWFYDETDETKNILNLTVAYTDSLTGYQHTVVCKAHITNGNHPTTNVENIVLKCGEESLTTFRLNTSVSYSEYAVKFDGDTDSFFTSSLSGENQTVKLRIKANSDNVHGRRTGHLYNKNNDQTLKYAYTFNVLIVEKDLQLDNTNISASLINDTVTITPTIDGVKATKSEVYWYLQSSEYFTYDVDDTYGSINLHFKKKTLEPVVIYCYETHTTESINYKKCYVNITDSHLKIQETTKTKFDLLDEGTNFTLKLDQKEFTGDVEWSTSNSTIASVDNTGKVVFVTPGSVTLTAKYTTKYGAVLTDSIEISIYAKKLVTIDSINALLTDTPIKLVGKIDGIEIPADKLVFISDDPTVVSVDDEGQLTYNSIGITQIHCYYKDYMYVQEYEAITTAVITSPEMEFSLEWYDTFVGTGGKKIHMLPKAYIEGLEIPFERLTWISESENLVILPNGEFKALEEGEYKIKCVYKRGSLTFEQTATIRARDFWVNNFEEKQPTIKSDSTTWFRKRTFQLKFWYDPERTEPIPIIDCTSRNKCRVAVDNTGLVEFKGHGWTDLDCKLDFMRCDGLKMVKETVVHARAILWWWHWIPILILILIIILIIILSCRRRKKNKDKKNKDNKNKQQETKKEGNKNENK